jgi:hypothetical protein
MGSRGGSFGDWVDRDYTRFGLPLGRLEGGFWVLCGGGDHDVRAPVSAGIFHFFLGVCCVLILGGRRRSIFCGW